MSTETGERRPERPTNPGTRPPEMEHLPCPRCDSTNTKFCYYNNYNLSQPRHFCKSCRRYWTRGGTLRNVPIGGGTRKRSRTVTTATASAPSSTVQHDPSAMKSVSGIPVIKPELGSFSGFQLGEEVNLNEPISGSFSSLLSTTQQMNEFVPLGGFGLGLGSGFHGLGFGLGPLDWPMEQVVEGNGGGGGGRSGGGPAVSGCDTWQAGGSEGGLENGDCFGWPDLAISTPGKVLK